MRARDYPLDIEEDMKDVPVGDEVGLAFLADPAAFLGGGFAARFQELIPADDFGADEAARQVRVDGAGGILGVGALTNGPGAAFVFASGEERDQLSQAVRQRRDLTQSAT